MNYNQVAIIGVFNLGDCLKQPSGNSNLVNKVVGIKGGMKPYCFSSLIPLY